MLRKRQIIFFKKTFFCVRSDSPFLLSRKSEGVQEIVATSAISAGDEVTVSYLPAKDEGSDVRSVRQEYLLTWYGFRCLCRACLKDGEELEADDGERRRIKSAQSSRSGRLDLLPLSSLKSLSLGLRRVGAKLPYRLEVGAVLLERALREGDLAAAAAALADNYSMEAVIGGGGGDGGRWASQVEGERPTMVEVGGEIHLFPAFQE